MTDTSVAAAFTPIQPPEDVFATARRLLDHCPVGWSEQDGGFWVVSDREHVLQVLQSHTAFHVGGDTRAVRIPADPPGFNRPLMPPQDVNPPIHRDFRAIINPYLSPQHLESHRAGFRRIIAGLIDGFASEDRCDIADRLAKVFPAKVTFRELFGIEDEHENAIVLGWVTRIIYGRFAEPPSELARLQDAWNRWTDALIERRRLERRPDVVDALVYGTVDGGRPLTHAEIVGALQVLTLGGFMTTSDAACNIVVALIEHPELQTRLREEPALIAPFVEEVLRLEPPVAARPRRCVAAADVAGHQIEPMQRVLVNLVAANRDPLEFDRPDDFDIARERNRHLAFGAGIHRCVGSNMARMTLHIVVEELLARVTDVRFDEGAREHRRSVSGATWRLVDSLPIRYSSVHSVDAGASCRGLTR